LREAVNDDPAFLAFPYEKLLWRIGMTRTVIETDWNDDFLASGQCWSTARDFGRLGLLYLADGMWNGERILPEHWSNYVATPAPAQPGPGSIGGEAGYGAQFWLHNGLRRLPAAYAAFGAKGQYAMIIPSKDLVLIRRGFDNRTPFQISQFASDVLQALDP
jgi:CubicO group peptidase (beta-lactamase class C family)